MCVSMVCVYSNCSTCILTRAKNSDASRITASVQAVADILDALRHELY